MTRGLPAMALLLLLSAPIHADVHGVAFAPSPDGEWQCGLTNEDFPGLAAEHMTQPLAAGCERGETKAYAVIVDLSDSRSVMQAEQMAGDAEEQLPTTWKIDSKSYDVITLPGGRLAAYSRLTGRGDGFTFMSGQKPMVAISANVPLLFEDAAGAPRQVITVFRVRAPLPAAAANRKETVAELDRMLREWAATARPASGRFISDRDFELAAYARTKGLASAEPRAAVVPAASVNERERISAAVAGALDARATPADVAMLEQAAQQYEQLALGELARSLLSDVRRTEQLREQEQVLTTTLEAAKEKAGDVLSRFFVAGLQKGDTAGITAALPLAKKYGWTLRSAGPAASAAFADAAAKRTWSPPAADRALFELSSTELLQLARKPGTVPRIEDIARPARAEWRMKQRDASKAGYLVEKDNGLGLLERQPGTGQYKFRLLTNLFDIPATDAGR